MSKLNTREIQSIKALTLIYEAYLKLPITVRTQYASILDVPMQEVESAYRLFRGTAIAEMESALKQAAINTNVHGSLLIPVHRDELFVGKRLLCAVDCVAGGRLYFKSGNAYRIKELQRDNEVGLSVKLIDENGADHTVTAKRGNEDGWLQYFSL